MGHRPAIKRLSGTKANVLETLPLSPGREAVFGRDRECHVRYGESDDLVSRKHLKIVASNDTPARYMLVDLGSRNGTFVNRQRVFGSVVLLPGARVQLGGGGPEFEFRLENEEAAVRVRSRWSWLAKALLALVASAAAGTAGYRAWPRIVPLWREWRRAQARSANQPRFNPATASASVAGIEAQWSVVDSQTGTRLALACMSNTRASDSLPLVEGGPATLPVFVMDEDRRIEPLLVPAGSANAGHAVTGEWKSKGVIVSQAGAVLTARPVQRPWDVAHQWPPEQTAGALLVLEGRKIARVAPIAASQFPQWTPAASGFIAERFPEDLRGDLRGRWAAKADLRVDVTASVREAGHVISSSLMGEPSDIWLATPEPGAMLAGLRVPPLDDGRGRVSYNQPVWVVGNEVEKSEIRDTAVGNSAVLHVSRCRDGGVVFDQGGRVLALCIPNAGSEARPDAAVPVRRGLMLLSGAVDGIPY